MKKITLLFLFLSSFAYSQVLSEDFEGSLTLPPGWTNNDIAGGGEIWTFDNSGDAIPNAWGPGNGYYYSVAMMAGNYALFDSDAYGGIIPENAALESPSFDCSSLSNVTLSFSHFFTDGFGGQGFVEVFNGSIWVNVASYGASTEFGYVTLNVTSALAGVSNARVRFRWVGDYAWGWAFDNVSVYECTDSAPNAVINPSPANGATDVALDQSDINYPNRLFFTWADGVGDPGTSFTFNLGTTNPPTEYTFTGFINGDFIYGFDYNTTYYWSIDAINCGGISTPTVWSFTTEMDPALSIEDNELSKIKVVALNKSIGLYNLPETARYNVYNMTGQEVLRGITNNKDYVIEASTLSSGVYIVELGDTKSNAVFRKKVVLQ
jgi:hypothetical protein